jgi:hypothetical protein
MDDSRRYTLTARPNPEQMHQYQIEMRKDTERHCNEPIIEIPPTPPHENPGAQSDEEFEQEFHDEIPPTPPYEDPGAQSDEEFEQEFHDDNIEDIGYDEVIDLRPIKPIENAEIRPARGKEIVPIQPRASPTPMIKRYRLRTEYSVYGRISILCKIKIFMLKM